MTKEELVLLAQKHQIKADREFQNYQETGITRFYTAHKKHEDMADAFRMAANASEEHHAYIAMRAQLSDFAHKAKVLKYTAADQRETRTDALLREIVSYGVLHGFIKQD